MDLDSFAKKLATQLGSREWVNKNQAKLLALYPETWTHIDNIDADKFLADLSALGIDAASDQDFSLVVTVLDGLRISVRENAGYLVKRNVKFDIHA